MLTGSRKAPRTAGGSAANLDPGIKSRSHSFCFAPRSHTQYPSIKCTSIGESTHPAHTRSTCNRPEYIFERQCTLLNGPYRSRSSCVSFLLYAPVHCKETHPPAHAQPHATAPSTSASTSTSSTGSENLPCECMCSATQPLFLNTDRLSLRALHSALVPSFSSCNRHHARAPGS